MDVDEQSSLTLQSKSAEAANIASLSPIQCMKLSRLMHLSEQYSLTGSNLSIRNEEDEVRPISREIAPAPKKGRGSIR